MRRPDIVPIVEGYGDVKAVPLLLHRVLEELHPNCGLRVGRTQNALGRSNLENPVVLGQLLDRAWLVPRAGVIIVLDADKDCPRDVALRLAATVSARSVESSVAVVCAKRRFENWIRAGFQAPDASDPPDFDDLPGGKGWIEKNLSGLLTRGSYDPTADQCRLTRRLDLNWARRSGSFCRLIRAANQLIEDLLDNRIVVTPSPEP